MTAACCFALREHAQSLEVQLGIERARLATAETQRDEHQRRANRLQLRVDELERRERMRDQAKAAAAPAFDREGATL